MEGKFCLGGPSNVSYPNWCKIMVFAFLCITIHSAKHGHTDPEWIFLYYKMPSTLEITVKIKKSIAFYLNIVTVT